MADDIQIERRLTAVETTITTIPVILQELKNKMDEVSRALSGLAAIEAKQVNHSQALERAFSRIDAAEERVEEVDDRITAEIKTHHDDDMKLHKELMAEIDKAKAEASLARKESAEQSSKLKLYLAVVTGFGVGVTAVWTVVAWLLKNDIVAILTGLNKAGGGGG